MEKFGDFFYKFLKISVTVALISLFFAVAGMAIASGVTKPDIGLIVLMLTALALCILFSSLKIKSSYKIFLIIAVAFVTRLIWIINVNSVPVSDYLTIYNSANEFLNGDKSALRDYGYLARFPHLVPMMVYVMGMIKVFGVHHIFAIKAVNLILSSLNVYLIYVLSAYYVKKPIARYAAIIIAAVFPPFISYCSTFCTENIAITFFLLSVIIFNKAIMTDSKKPLWFFLCGCVLYLSNLFRAVGIIFLIAFGLYTFIFCKKKNLLSFVILIAGYMLIAILISSVLMGTGVTEAPLWKGKEPSFATLMLKGSNFDHMGMWNVEDAQFVDKYLKSENLSEKCFEVIGSRLSEKSIPEITTFYLMKFFSQWSKGDFNGTYWATLETDIPYIYPLPYIFQVIYVAVLLMSVFIFKSKKEGNAPLALPLILLCGFGVAFMILETQERYSYIVSWLFIILAVSGLENLMNEHKIKSALSLLYEKYKSEAMYIIFGIVTTVINILVYVLTYNIFHIPNIISTVIAWFISVAVAYVTNKIWVFESKSYKASVLLKELSAFFSCRLATGIIDIAIMWICVDIMHLNSTLVKILANVIVIVLNYIVSKKYIFKKEA